MLAGEAIYRTSEKNRLAVPGPTRSGRMMTVIIEEAPHQAHQDDVFRARPASRRERRIDQREQGGSLS